MTIIEAIKIGKRFRRFNIYRPMQWINPGSPLYQFSKEDLVSEDWQIDGDDPGIKSNSELKNIADEIKKLADKVDKLSVKPPTSGGK